MNRDDVIYAFPTVYFTAPNFQGMTLRDYFAGQALVGLLSRTEEKHGGCTGFDGLSLASYATADALLNERAK